jgi:glucose-6-phosphate 1-epimerase
MEYQNVANLNRMYSRHKKLFFEEGPGGFPLAQIRTERGSATLAMYGAQLIAFKPAHAEHDLFYLSDDAVYQAGKAIRGGAPLCWPWFGADPDDAGHQAHGFVRNMFWELLDTRIHDNVVSATFGIESTHVTHHKWWDHDFKLRKTITVGDELTVSLTTENHDDEPLRFSEALHSYLLVGDISQVSVQGLDKTEYLDKTLGFALETQQGDIKIDNEFDRIYLQSPTSTEVLDPSLNRKIKIQQLGAENFVIWNPWTEKTKQLADMPDDDFKLFICVETANALDHSVTIPAGHSHTMEVNYKIESLG